MNFPLPQCGPDGKIQRAHRRVGTYRESCALAAESMLCRAVEKAPRNPHPSLGLGVPAVTGF